MSAPTVPAKTRAPRALAAVALGLALGLALVSFVATPALVAGSSMEPTLRGGDLVLLLRPGFDRLLDGALQREERASGYGPGDVVAYRSTAGGLVLKRVVAAGSATVAFEEGRLLVDGRPSEVGSHDTYRGADELGPIVLAPGELFVVGDNRRPLASRDSRHTGPLDEAAVLGRLVALVPLGGLFAR